MNRKQQFIQAVQILAPGDPFILRAAERVREETLPPIPGGVALEFVAAMERFRSRFPHQAKTRRRKRQQRSDHRNKTFLLVMASGQDPVGKPVPVQHPIALQHALRIKSAENWLELGQPLHALVELEHLPKGARKHPWAMRVMDLASSAARELEQMSIQE